MFLAAKITKISLIVKETIVSGIGAATSVFQNGSLPMVLYKPA